MRHSEMRSCLLLLFLRADQGGEVAKGAAPACVDLGERGPAAAGDGTVVDAVVDLFLERARWNRHGGSLPHAALGRTGARTA